MDVSSQQQVNKFVISKLFKLSFSATALHIGALAFLLFITWPVISQTYVVNWALVTTCGLLTSLLYQTMFLRRYREAHFKFSKWEKIIAANTFGIALMFAVAYCFVMVFGAPEQWHILLLAAIMHMTIFTMITVYSKQTILCASIPLSLPIIAAMVYANVPFPLVIAMAIFCLGFIVLAFSINHALYKGNKMWVKYAEQSAITRAYANKLERATIEDELTQIFNRRFFDLTIHQEVRRAKRASSSFSLAIVQIDSFDQYEDHYGEDNARNCLKKVANALDKATLRGGEFVCRFDKDMFALTLPNVTTESACAFASKLVDIINALEIEHQYASNTDSLIISANVGITEFTPNDIVDVDEVIEQALHALDKASHNYERNIEVFNTVHRGQEDIQLTAPHLVVTNANNVA